MLSYCVLPPVHFGQDLVYSGITVLVGSVGFRSVGGASSSLRKLQISRKALITSFLASSTRTRLENLEGGPGKP